MPDPHLAASTLPVGDLPLCRVLLSDGRRFPSLLLVPRRAAPVEAFRAEEGFSEVEA